MKKGILYKGWHSEEFINLLDSVLMDKNSFLLICPPRFELPSLNQLIKNLPIKNWSYKDQINNEEGHFENTPSKNNCENFEFKIGLFTSGSTGGEQKIVLYNIENFLTSTNSIYSLFKDFDSLFCYPQPYHIFGLSLGYLFAKHHKKTLFVPKGKYSNKAHRLWTEISLKNSKLITLGTPTHFTDLISFITSSQTPYQKSYSCIIGGAPVKKTLWYDIQDKLKISEPSIGYGCTEASPGLFHLPPGITPSYDFEIGSPLKDVKINFLNDGTFTFSGKNLSPAWVDDRGLHSCTSLKVPDALKKIKNSKFIFAGRLTDWINRGGEKFSFTEIENTLSESLNIQCICLKKQCARLGEDIYILIEGLYDENFKSTVQNTFYERYSRKLNMENIYFIKKLPLNDSSKIDRIKCLKIVKSQL